MWYRANPDEEMQRQRRHSFGGDIYSEARYLQTRVRAGSLDPNKLELAAYLNYPAAILLVPDPIASIRGQLLENYDRRPQALSKFQDPDFISLTSDVSQALHFGFLELEFLVSVAADFVEHVMFIWEHNYPDDDLPVLAIQEVRKWLDDFPATYDAVHGHQIQELCRGASGAARAVDDIAAGQVADAAAGVLAGALHGRGFVEAPGSAVLAARASDDEGAEVAWQRQHLIEMLLED